MSISHGDSLGWRDESYSNNLKMHLSPRRHCLGCCPFWGGASLVVDDADLLVNVLLIMGGSVFVFVLVCITLCPS